MSEQKTEKDERACVVCGTRTDRWVHGWDDKYRCIQHAPDGPRPFTGEMSEFLIEADQGHMELIHEPCGERLLVTLHVHMDTLARLTREHVCSPRSASHLPPAPPNDVLTEEDRHA